ncbi:MAG: RNA-directed DNA polymerase [Sandaracinaceae bacterium]|nr:MAG: RNA-directed DNA polymerase [Sandaracinaceae bacterium]
MSIVDSAAASLGVSRDKILTLADQANHSYVTYSIPKKSGGEREIHHPSKPLKAVQRWFLRRWISLLPVSPLATAYEPGSSVLKNALVHEGAKYAVRIDLQDFYWSISSDDFRSYLATVPAGAEIDFGDVETVAALLFRHGRLTVGSPTSPSLSNRMCRKLDTECEALAVKIDARYSRYADDMYFSATHPGILSAIESSLESILSGLDTPGSLRINKSKTQHFSQKTGIFVTGLVIGSDGKVYLGRRRKREIRALIHNLESLDLDARRRLAGKISFARSIEPAFVNALIKKYTVGRFRSASRPDSAG